MDKTVLRNSLGLVLNGIDILVAGVLALGGWNATNSHPMTGYIAMGMAPLLLYLSSGVWTRQTWKLITRLILYAGVFVMIVVISAASFFATLPDARFIYWLGAGFLMSVLISATHFRLVRKTTKGEQSLTKV
jgi:hypothetical protein